MPEGPEVRKYADALDAVLTGRKITQFEARTREAKHWLAEQGSRLTGQRVLKVRSHGKHLLGYIESGFYFHSHLMMWGRWLTFPGKTHKTRARRVSESESNHALPLERDRRERARILVDDGGAALLFSAPIFNVGEGDPYEQIENLNSLGPDVLPYPRSPRTRRGFDKAEFQRRLLLPEHREITIGAALLNQRIVAGLGNYLRAEVLFNCRLNPWRKVGELTEKDLRCLSRAVPELSLRAYLGGATAKEAERARMREDASLVYQPNREMGTRHLVFRRTNLPCLRCGTTIKQLRQPTYNGSTGEEESEERTRIVYFCPRCQGVVEERAVGSGR